MHLDLNDDLDNQYVCQVFCHKKDTNRWSFVFTFADHTYLDVSFFNIVYSYVSILVQAIKKFNKNTKYTEYGSEMIFNWKSDKISFTVPAVTGWRVVITPQLETVIILAQLTKVDLSCAV